MNDEITMEELERHLEIMKREKLIEEINKDGKIKYKLTERGRDLFESGELEGFCEDLVRVENKKLAEEKK
jgi:predicted transcriptional regulator